MCLYFEKKKQKNKKTKTNHLNFRPLNLRTTYPIFPYSFYYNLLLDGWCHWAIFTLKDLIVIEEVGS